MARSPLAVIIAFVTVTSACTSATPPATSSPTDTPAATTATVQPSAAQPTTAQVTPVATATNLPAATFPTGVQLSPCGSDPQLVCGTLPVPIDRAEPDGDKLSLAFRLLRRSDMSQPPIATVVSLPGGPGSSAGGDAIAEGLQARYDLLFMDPRGSGESDAINCPDLQNGSANIAQLRAGVAACGAQLGAHADRYGAADIALDLEDLRAHLGLEQVDLFGTSFGTVLAQAYAARFPERVHAVVLDSGLVLDETSLWNLGYPRAWLGVIARYCAQVASCVSNHPDSEEELGTFLVEAGDEPVRVLAGGQEVVFDQTALVAIMASVGPFPDNVTAPRLLNAVSAHAAGDDSMLLGLREFVDLSRGDSGDPTGYSAGMNVAAACNEQPLPWDPASSAAEREQQLADSIARLPEDAFEPITVQSWLAWLQPETCLDWPVPDGYEPALPPGTTINVPALVLAGEQDSVVPNHATRELLDVFQNATWAPIAGAIHSVMGWSLCPRDLVSTFLTTLEVDGETCAPDRS